MASHSRFTDEIYCTPAPSAPRISVRTVDQLRDEIFCDDHQAPLRQCLYTAEEMKSKDLYENYPPSFRDKNKQYIFKYINEIKQYSPAPDRSLLITRWKPFLPNNLPDDLTPQSTKVIFQPDVFSYQQPSPESQTVEWYLNFANHDLFAYYSGPLLAQDELQVLECIELAALREYFVQTTNTVGSSTVASDKNTQKQVPTPILISNTERVVQMDTTKVYGNAFAKASQRQLIQACQYLPHAQTVNLIAIEAPSYGRGSYTRDQVDYILVTCYVGFKAAQILANKTHALNTRNASGERNSRFRTVIHTGWWGCGAYGNNRQMMILTQLLTAYWAQIDELVFHTQTNDYQRDIDAAQVLVEKMLKEKDVENVIDQIVLLNLQWERSNDT